VVFFPIPLASCSWVEHEIPAGHLGIYMNNYILKRG